MVNGCSRICVLDFAKLRGRRTCPRQTKLSGYPHHMGILQGRRRSSRAFAARSLASARPRVAGTPFLMARTH
ncbi:hypothetical protein PISMIDRAFT_670256 [Pisolithus microcarpus 441]|uniref:Uncharacterized protein n=1 Tax=Pisolithus microcarpus 441 TaxID=765257 RepID=A0A0C9ZPH9_9AGAM|nr:hypothetical protein PISMIDRAFT_670256 [Pisolithus microcarpus 441]